MLALLNLHMEFQRYRKTGPKKRFRFGIFAPLPKDFVKLCSDLEIQLGTSEIKGGMSVDGVGVEGDELPDLDGEWMR
jgi:hypothetical protein